MMLSDDSIIEYQQIYKAEFGIELSFELATEKAAEFLRLMKILYKAIPDQKGEESI